ncbi:MAG TPA: hypothetical protein PLF91_10110 [Mycolicibacterium fallax]|nr:hypothetical protein [Mycolicibacterium fallax]
MTALHDFLDTAHADYESQTENGGVEDHTSPGAHIPCDSQGLGGVGGTDSPQPIVAPKATDLPAAAPNLPTVQSSPDRQCRYGGGDSNQPQPTFCPAANSKAVAAPDLPSAQAETDGHQTRGAGDQATEPAHVGLEGQEADGGFGPNQPTPPSDDADSQSCIGSVGPNVPPPPKQLTDSQEASGGGGPILRDPTLALAADVVDDLERVKIANQNRLRTLTAQDEYGHGMSVDHPDVKRLAALVKALEDAEHQATLNLARVMRHHPLGGWVKASKGVGEKQAARLLASIGDPYWNDLHSRPRRLRELYAFCGMSVVGTGTNRSCDSQTPCGAGSAPTKVRGERVTWNPDARMRLWLIASKTVMVGHGGPYRQVYDEGRLKYADAIHAEECKRCGPKGKPAQPDSPLSAAHQHARAIRLIAKAILRDLWTAAKNIHEGEQK